MTRPDPATGPDPDVCFVSMPYATLTTPSLALGLLKAILADEGITAAVAPANLWFAEAVGLSHYEQCSSRFPIVWLTGEWTFAAAAFGDDPRREAKDAAYLRQVSAAVARRSLPGKAVGRLRELRVAATRFVDEAAQRVLATGARVVGCTSTFEQHVASLALLRRIRELDPGVVTMLGGANCETVMGEATHRCFPWVDYVVSGEADGIIADLCRLAMTKGRDATPGDLPAGVLGPCHRNTAGARSVDSRAPGAKRPAPARALSSGLDGLPAPDYDDYFAALAASPLASRVRPGIPLESSRGCWWGAVHQCTFCGLNGTGLAYRSKSPDRVLAEMRELEDKHQISDFEMVDNILDAGYYNSLLPRLAEDDRRRRLFFEIKANLTREHVQTLVRAGVTWVQPGIESLHTEVLRLMDKGIKGWQNIQLLKWSGELGLRVSWSMLWGFPGEKNDWYEEVAGWLPALEHLQPPSGAVRLRYDRYSVYHEQARKMGLSLFPIGAMSFIYPVWPADIDRLAYFFSTEPATGPLRYLEDTAAEVAKFPGIGAVTTAARAWREAYYDGSPSLWMADRDGELAITDTRGCTGRARHRLRGLDRAVYLACDRAPRPGKLAEIVRRDFGLATTDDQIAPVVDRLVSDRLVLPIDGRLLGLALGGPPAPLPGLAQFPGGYVQAARATVPAESR
ncbi:MAG TPA: RiPP maturation radical SAM C-methyltransferase [Streptosporangiaceae bacterium]|jgi:ribosomal peptide maturation radical SAM protein 1